ncbi:aminoglycoside phosphotransferase family protein [Methylocaldum sp.]|uniref:aminoglycoside phosphotransferase family protein n=1 Tax=Methylocaldum sp. TaxID=1969727 RepID=UPI002D2449BD|nr:phosphotransferase [Methylocaldum sp.]HYE34708.1 phosphotransferase [Methylocaldum sp.]
MTIQQDDRLEALSGWLRETLRLAVEAVEPASSDASFRRYFRVYLDGISCIVMDAPPAKENVRPFIGVAALLRDAGVQAPEILAADEEQGFLLLSDFGTRSYLDCLNAISVDRLYGDALDALTRLQCGVDIETAGLPVYDERLLGVELDLFRDWFLDQFLGLVPEAAESVVFDDVKRLLIASALEQPKVCVHRDYHSRNLMVTERLNPGVLDFQDAVIGPVTYDLASLLRDCYVSWPLPMVEVWMAGYYTRLCEAGLVGSVSPDTFRRWFDLMGMQRHLKAIGIFSRLKLRDGKFGYLKDIPRTMSYVTEVCGRYPELAGFLRFLEKRVLPQIISDRLV